MNLNKVNKILNVILIVFLIYAVYTIITQQNKINSYEADISYYNTQIQDLNNEKNELLETQNNVNSEGYIENVAREDLDMYLPNETVFIDANK